MVIREQHFDGLAQSRYVEFEKRTAAWLAEHFPDDCHLLGTEAVCGRIRYALQNGFRYGFYAESDAARFVYLCFLLGPDFDLAPEFAWLRAILSNTSAEPPARLDRAYDELESRLESTEREASA